MGLGFLTKDGKVKIAAENEAEPVIDTDRRLVFREDMKKRCATASKDVLHGDVDEDAGKAPASCGGMGADGTDLNELRQTEALAGHSEKRISFEDAPEGAEFAGALAEWTRLGERRELAHGGDVDA